MTKLNYDFEDAVVIVTGAARGVGREIVHQFVGSGARVVAADRDADGLAETVVSWRWWKFSGGVVSG